MSNSKSPVVSKQNLEEKVKSMWAALRVAEGQTEKRGLQFGEAMYEYREMYYAQGRRTDLVTGVTKSETFEEFCDRLSIVRMTAYRWIARYEETIGEREPKITLLTESDPELEYETERVQAKPTDKSTMDKDDLSHLAYRLGSVSKTIQQILNNKKRWATTNAYASVVEAGRTLLKLLEKL